MDSFFFYIYSSFSFSLVRYLWLLRVKTMPFLLLNCTFPWTLWEWPMESMAIPSMQERHFLYPTEDPCHSLMISPGFLSYIIIWFSCYGIWNENHSWVKKRKQTFLVANCFICFEIKEMTTFPFFFLLSVCFCVILHIHVCYWDLQEWWDKHALQK